MANILQRFGKAIRAFNSSMDMGQVAKQLDVMIASGSLPTASQVEREFEQKEVNTTSKLDVRRTERNVAYASMYSSLRSWVGRTKGIMDNYDYDDPSRDYALSIIWKQEPIMAGAIYSMCAKFSALSWNITGKRLPARRYATILSEAAHIGGYGWGAYIASVANDFLTLNRGTFSETAKEGDPSIGPLAELGHIDALNCTLTGNSKYPMEYWSDTTGQHIRFQPGEYFHVASLPSPREMHVGSGFCAVDRSLRALKLLMGLHDYDDEKLANLPPEGVAAVTGLTLEEFNDALALWRAARQKDNSLTFPQVLWLLASQPNAEISVTMTPFSTLPEAFDRKSVVDQYATTLALCLGVDVREIWTIASGGGLGSAGESEIQHMKAKGKGPGEFITATEREINGELPEGVDWGFDTQDIEEDANQAAIAKAWIDAYFPLYNLPPAGQKSADGVTNPRPESKANPQPNKPNGQPNLPTTPIPGVDTGRDMTNGGGQPNQPQQAEQVLSKKDFLRLLVDKKALPQWMVNDERLMLSDSTIHVSKEGHPDDVTKLVWDGRTGLLKEERVFLGSFYSGPDLPEADVMKGGEGSGNFGHAGRPGKAGGSSPSATIPAGGMNLDWKVEDTIKGSLVLEGIDPDISDDDLKIAIMSALPGALPYVNKASDIDDVQILSRDSGADWIEVKLDVTPSEQAGQNWLDHMEGEEEWSLYHGQKQFNNSREAMEWLVAYEKEIRDLEAKRNITGNPIPTGEAPRGTRVTAKTVRDELKRWRDDPVLAPYALTEDEEAELLKLEPVK